MRRRTENRLNYHRMHFVLLMVVTLFSVTAAFAAKTDQTGATANEVFHDTMIWANLSSPHSTWHSMISLIDEYNSIIKKAGFTPENVQGLMHLETEIANCIDLRDVAPSVRVSTAMETAVYLRELLARFETPPSDFLPDRDEAYQEIKQGQPPIWRIADSPISITLMKEGEHAGDFQFSARTITIAQSAFELLKDRPYVDKSVEGLFENYFLTPGAHIPQAWIRRLPLWMSYQYLHNTVWQWLSTLLGLILIIAFIFFSGRWIHRMGQKRQVLSRTMIRITWPLLSSLVTIFVIHFLANEIFITGQLLLSVRFMQYVILLVAGVAMVISMGNLLAEWAVHLTRYTQKSIDTYLIRLGIRLVSMTIAVIVIIEGLQKMGFSLATVLAGAGVTGLAIALAAQESLRNIFGSIMLLLDKPFTVGQRVLIRGHDGVVENIGMRSTKIRLLSGHLSSIPNDDVARADIENVGERPYIRRKFSVTITYDTPLEKIDEAVAILRDILAVKECKGGLNAPERQINTPDHPPRVYFNDLNADSLNILVIYWFVPADYWAAVAFDHHVNREIIRRFNEAGIEFAFPTQTLFMAGDPNRPLDIGLQPDPEPNKKSD
ncbi:MAG: mechanosensitive ion channel family protein [Spartobacteria bacterium]|nr:mechanosensitive ion channel family protein [Spartobacteria bacterium]